MTKKQKEVRNPNEFIMDPKFTKDPTYPVLHDGQTHELHPKGARVAPAPEPEPVGKMMLMPDSLSPDFIENMYLNAAYLLGTLNYGKIMDIMKCVRPDDLFDIQNYPELYPGFTKYTDGIPWDEITLSDVQEYITGTVLDACRVTIRDGRPIEDYGTFAVVNIEDTTGAMRLDIVPYSSFSWGQCIGGNG